MIPEDNGKKKGTTFKKGKREGASHLFTHSHPSEEDFAEYKEAEVRRGDGET